MITATRYHDFSCGHRVVGHESKCKYLHGHNYRVHFEVAALPHTGRIPELDALGRVVDFGVLKSTVCAWLEENWDHKMLLWRGDPLIGVFTSTIPQVGGIPEHLADLACSLVMVPFNPTAENMAVYLRQHICAELLEPLGIRAISVRVDETRKCSATSSLDNPAAFW